MGYNLITSDTVIINDIHPRESVISNLEKCYLGISINNSLFWSSKTFPIFEWIDKNFSDCIILSSGYLHRYNEQIFNAYSIPDSIEYAKRKETKLVGKIKAEIKKISDQKFKIIEWEKILEDDKFTNYREVIGNTFDTNDAFQEEIISSSTSFIEKAKRFGKTLKKSKKESIDLSVEYILEELTVFSVLISYGYNAQIYPGTQLKILKDFADGVYDEINSSLKDGIYIDLSVKSSIDLCKQS